MTQKSLRVQKSKERFTAHHGPGGVSEARVKVYLETQESDKNVFQNFRLVTSEFRLLQYFTDDKFTGYFILDREIAKYYAGDGERILYQKKIYYNNLVTVVFNKLDKDAHPKKELEAAQFEVAAPIPATLGCFDCEHFRKSNRMCMYYQEMGIKIRKSCSDFRQKR